MYWPKIEFPDIKHDAWRKNKRTGKIDYLWTADTCNRGHGRKVLQVAIEALEEDLQEGPKPSDKKRKSKDA